MKLKKTFNKLLIAACAFGTISTAPLMTLQAQAAEVANEPVVHGLKGEYYTGLGSPQFNFGTLKSTVLDPNLDFGNLEPAFGILTGQQDNVNVRWTGSLSPSFPKITRSPSVGTMASDSGLTINWSLIIGSTIGIRSR